MKELKNIVSAYDVAAKEGKKAALATVVHVEGSSYRSAGARMLVTDDGQLTGAISGGCLEGDALRKALLAIQQNKNKLVTYDTTDDDVSVGVQLGCNGIVHILFEPIEQGVYNQIELLREVVSERASSALVTLFSLDDRDLQRGTIMTPASKFIHSSNRSVINELEPRINRDIHDALESNTSSLARYEVGAEKLTAFIQVIPPAISLIIIGAGNDTMPLANIANEMGWDVTIVDGRQRHATSSRFPSAKKIVVSKAENALDGLEIDELTAVVLMTHNYNYDVRVLQDVIKSDCKYIGVLGPATKMQKMYGDLDTSGISVSKNDKLRIYAPVGLDIGAETAEEIALSIATEIKAVLSGVIPQSLRLKTAPIHSRAEPGVHI